MPTGKKTSEGRFATSAQLFDHLKNSTAPVRLDLYLRQGEAADSVHVSRAPSGPWTVLKVDQIASAHSLTQGSDADGPLFAQVELSAPKSPEAEALSSLLAHVASFSPRVGLPDASMSFGVTCPPGYIARWNGEGVECIKV